MFDLTSDSGHFVHVLGMSDTGNMGSICQRNRNLRDDDPSNNIGRTVVFDKGSGCDLGSLYEVWAFSFGIGERVRVLASAAVFDPITVFNPNNPSEQKFTKDVYETTGLECSREAYHGPVYWYNRNGDEEYKTDAYGNMAEDGVFTQRVSRHSNIGIPMTSDQTLFKQVDNYCVDLPSE